MGHFVQDAGHVLDKSHVQHPVRLVQHHGLHCIQPDGAPFHVVHEPAGGGDHDLGLVFQLGDLLVDGLAAVEAHHPHPIPEGAQVPQLIPNLDGQLPCGGQDEALDLVGRRVHVLHHGDAEGIGLAGASGSLGYHVLPLHEAGDGPPLDGGGLGEALFIQRFPGGIGQVHVLVIIDVGYYFAVDLHIVVPFSRA